MDEPFEPVFNPLVALQSLATPDVTAKQRVKAVQQLQSYFAALAPTPGLLMSYEPYLPLLTDLLVTPGKGARELQSSVLALLQTLSSHNPYGFSDWIARNTQLGNEPWLVQWSYELLLQAEKRVPRVEDAWDDKSAEFLEFDRAFVRIMQMWRALIDHTGEEALIAQIVKCLQALVLQEHSADSERWKAALLKKLQPHFVDIADVLIGWTMSTGARNQLRNDILAFLHGLDRLWADNSVFSLQLLNSFADEIVNMCDSWNGHQSGDDDRLSTLLACFMMVTQCVSHLALSAGEEQESPFTRVLRRVAVCPEPAYSLDCVASCSEYLLSISNARHDIFPSLSIVAARFLLYHCAVQGQSHDTEIDKLSLVVENVYKLVKDSSLVITKPECVRQDALGMLEDEIPVRSDKKNHQPKRSKVMEYLFHLKYANGIKCITQLCLILIRIGGVTALKIVGAKALQRPGSRKNTERGNSYFVFMGTCFILSCRAPGLLILKSDEDVAAIAVILSLISQKLVAQNQEHHHHKLPLRQLCVLLKMAHAFLVAVPQLPSEIGISYAMENVVVQALECAISVLPADMVPGQDDRLALEMLKVVKNILVRPELTIIPTDIFHAVLNKINSIAHCSSCKVREECIQVLPILALRAEGRAFSGDIFEVCLDLLFDPSNAIQDKVVSSVLSDIARHAVIDVPKERTFRRVPVSVDSTFALTDFESIMGLFNSQECDVSKWNRLCRRIVRRCEKPDDRVYTNAAVLLSAVRQASMWCVQNRLRTHFGGPAQTFSSIERLVMSHCEEDHAIPQPSANAIEPGFSVTSISKRGWYLSKWLLLEFVSALEMRISHAISGKFVDQSDPESESYKMTLFFRTNKNVCEDWLNRIRPLLLEISTTGLSREYILHNNYALLSTCYNKLTKVMSSFSSLASSDKEWAELKQAEEDVDAALFSMCQSFCDGKDADSIVGFQKWADSTSAILVSWDQLNGLTPLENDAKKNMPFFGWIKAVRCEAEMRYEDATAEYELLLQPILEAVRANVYSTDVPNSTKYFEFPMETLRLSSHAILGCFKQYARCCVTLREWKKLRQLVDEFAQIVKELADSDRPVKHIQQIFDCNDAWNEELNAICSLESYVDDSEDEPISPSSETKRAAQKSFFALRVWKSFSDASSTHYQDTTATSHPDSDLLSRLQNDLRSLALQPAPWNGLAGESIGKGTEESLLRLIGLSNSRNTAFPVPEHIVDKFGLDKFKLNPALHDSAIWSQPLCLSSIKQGDVMVSSDADCMYLTSIAKLAREQHNFDFARTILVEAARIKGASKVPSLCVGYEKARLLEVIGNEDEGRHLVEMQCNASLASIDANKSSVAEVAMTAQSLLYLASLYTSVQSGETLMPTSSTFLRDLTSRVSEQDNKLVNFGPSFDPSDRAAMLCLHSALKLLPSSAKVWLRYSNWCYDRGKREIKQVDDQNGYIHLESSDELALNSLLSELRIEESSRDAVIRAFCHFFENGELYTQRFEKFRQACINEATQGIDSCVVDQLVELQRACHAKILRFHLLAARGYDNYLTVLLESSESTLPKQKMVMVALRLLGLLTTYGTEENMVTALEDVFSHGPITPWSCVVPQLIARAHHPAVAVSSLVCLILTRLAHYSPHSIVYPAVVDSMDTHDLATASLEGQKPARNAFASVITELQTVSSGKVEGVRLLVSELRRISILWDEAWISTLMKLSTDVARRTSTLDKEATRVERNASLSVREKQELAQRKTVAIMKPIMLSIERLWNETCGNIREQQVVSPHERKFLRDYGGPIEEAMAIFRECCKTDQAMERIGAKSPQELWHPFAVILKSLINSTGRREQIPLRDISPAIASNSSHITVTNIPGAISGNGSSQTEPITIHHIQPTVVVLRTKTKPKTLEFIGSDGKTYKYLLKAREDLRLDERIMQFLMITNEFLRGDKAAAARDLVAQNYSVIPLSRNAGLIQMVPDVVPLFQVYTSRSENLAGNSRVIQDQSSVKSGNNQPQLPPPTAQFYAKLKERGVANVSPNHRSQWPVPVLKQVYQELVAQRPRNVLHQEIISQSEDIRESWVKKSRLSKSLAVMSVLGYVVGLGDRHLDNILLCVKSGDIVHIDHNVCFDKGRRLKVPEVVPFRLTPMLQDALGFTGVEGKFRVAFETTLRVVRTDNTREALLTLLEAFVYSPLVDWIAEDTRRGRSGDLKARLEVNVNLSLFLSRAEERRQDTIFFGREYERFASEISSMIMKSGVPLVAILDYRKNWMALVTEERKLQNEVFNVEAQLHASAAIEETERAAMAEVNSVELLSSKKAMTDETANSRALYTEAIRLRALYNAVVEKKRAEELAYRSLFLETEAAVSDLSRTLSSRVKGMLALLKTFDKFKTVSKQRPELPATAPPRGSSQQRRTNKTSGSLSTEPTIPGYSFMENDRLVAILLRSIRSVKHLKLLEDVLEKHEDQSSALREVISHVDRALMDFSTQVDQLLAGEGNAKRTEVNSLGMIQRKVPTSGIHTSPTARVVQPSQTSTNTLIYGDISIDDFIDNELNIGRDNPRAYALTRALLDLATDLRLISDQSNETSTSLLVQGRNLVRECITLFFEATEMADRFSSTTDDTLLAVESTHFFSDGDDETEQQETVDVLGLEGNPVLEDSGDSVNDISDVTAEPKVITRVEEKSEYGLQVLKRVEEKLSGSVTEEAYAPILTVEQQASWLIDEATKVDNLCVMYEGWTPWI